MAEIEALVVKIEIIFKDGDWDRGLAIQNRKNSQFKNSPIPTGKVGFALGSESGAEYYSAEQ
ncbi:hypothetical protein CRG98_043774 [Punica granatum]|uniref:Uncharacterized protein n=1 Tax=Punica granatum TaxID=22663 RepID=A0A2I0HVY7_PUNGR|nr:hypothetical protein CRG98_043774 [Punica granatum]